MKFPAKLSPDSIFAIIDSREQRPLNREPLEVVRGTLVTADYSVVGLENVIAIERKSLPDLIACVSRERQRFEREVQRMLAFPVRGLVLETTWEEIESGNWRGDVQPNQVIGSVLGWICSGLPVILAGSHERAGRFVSRMLFCAARRRYSECRTLLIGTVGPDLPPDDDSTPAEPAEVVNV